jgi:hypothetical protein
MDVICLSIISVLSDFGFNSSFLGTAIFCGALNIKLTSITFKVVFMKIAYKALSLIIIGVLSLVPFALHAQPVTGGPVVLMGIDAEDGGHPPPANYTNLVNTIYTQSTKRGNGDFSYRWGCWGTCGSVLV